VSVESQVTAGSTPFQGGSDDLGPSRERLDGPAALTFGRLAEVNRQRAARWHPGYPHADANVLGGASWTGADWSNAMCGEAGEAANVVKKLRRVECGLVGKLDAPETTLRAMLAEELADVITYADLLATYYGIDLAAAVATKFNAVSVRQGFPERLP